MTPVSKLLDYAASQLQSGNVEQAEEIYRQITQLDPTDVTSRIHLADILVRANRLDEAGECIHEVIRIDPNRADAHFRLGNVARRSGQLIEAVACYREALRIDPNHQPACLNLGVALRELNELVEAIACFKKALEINPKDAFALNHLGVTFADQHDYRDAIECYRKALGISPGFAPAHYNLGVALQNLGRLLEAENCYREALRIYPDFVEARCNLGHVLLLQRKPLEASECFRQALRVNLNLATAHFHLGMALLLLGESAQAVDCFRRALRIDPEHSDSYYHLGNVLAVQGQLSEAIRSYERAVELKPDEIAYLACLVHHLQHICEWGNLEVLTKRLIDAIDSDALSVRAGEAGPFYIIGLHVPTTARQQMVAAQRMCRSYAGFEEGRLKLSPRMPAPKIRVGYLSTDFHEHAVAYLIAELFEKHDRSRFQVFGYSIGREDNSSMRKRIANAMDRFVDLERASHLDAAKAIAADGIDILIDLNGHTGNARPQILALRPAPISVQYLGYPGTMGASFVDYILVDEFVAPPQQQPFFSEQLVHLPGSYQVNDRQRHIANSTPNKAECGLAAAGFVFCDFNIAFKISKQMFDVWMNLLKAVPGSVLWLWEANSSVAANLRREAENRGVAADRIVFAPKQPLAEHLARHRLADLFLDTFPYNAHTSASDALWAGCPVLTLSGETFASRVAGSLLRAVGLPELVTTTLAEYEALALRLARDVDLLGALRSRLAVNRDSAPLFDSSLFARDVERAYELMWQNHMSGASPRAFAL